jgi:hypothetical protein
MYCGKFVRRESLRILEPAMTFLNRQDEIDRFGRFLEPDSPEWIFAVHGIPGTGKTALLRQFCAGPGAGWVVAWIGFEQERCRSDARSVLQALTDPLRQCRLPAGSWEAYEQRVADLEQRPWVISQNITADNRSTIIRPTQSITIQESEARASQYREAQHERARAWLDLAGLQDGNLLVFLDHWDTLRRRVEDDDRAWLVEDLLLGGHRALPSFRAVVASDRPLASDPLITHLVDPKEIVSRQLPPLDDDDALELMRQQGVEDAGLQKVILEHCRGLPALINLAVAAWRERRGLDLDTLAEDLDTETASKWFLGELVAAMNDDRSRLVLQKGVILRQWILDTLSTVCERGDLDLLWLNDFASYPFVQDSKNHPGFKEFVGLVREIEVAQLWQQQPAEFQRLHRNALNWYRQTDGLATRT